MVNEISVQGREIIHEGVAALLKTIRHNPGDDARRIVRLLARRRLSRGALNWVYQRLSTQQRAAFHGRFSKIFREPVAHFEAGEWNLTFCGKPLKVSLTQKDAWLEWDVATSILGHETEIKQTYECLLRLPSPPRVVFDIGANYGTQSILFLVHGVHVISFEPNPRCREFFRRLSNINGVESSIEALAVGSREGTVELWSPENEEWLGTTKDTVMEGLARSSKLVTHEVKQTTIDLYVKKHSLVPHLIKIDTEGNDFDVLRGGAETLRSGRPLVLFESWRTDDRMPLLEFLEQHQYRICGLPVLSDRVPATLTGADFTDNESSNFGAVPEELLRAWPPRFL